MSIRHKVKGKVVKQLKRSNGVASSGKDWEKREYLLLEDGTQNSYMRFSVTSFDGPIARPLGEGDNIELQFEISCREYQGNWFNEIKATAITFPEKYGQLWDMDR